MSSISTSFLKSLAVTLAMFSSTAAMGQQDSVSTKSPATSIYKKITDKEAPNWMEDLSKRIKLHGYAQGGYSYSNSNNTHTNSFEFKRALFWADAQITDRWSFRFMHNFSSSVLEYFTDFRITKNKALNVRFGQFKNALAIENGLSCSFLEAIDLYSESVSFLAGCSKDTLYGSQTGRDLGIAIFGETNNGKWRYELNVMNGQGINKKDGNNFKDIIGRIEFRPIEGLNIVTSGQIGRGHAIAWSLYNPTIAVGEDYKRHRWTMGAEYKSRVFYGRAEYLEGRDGNVTSRGGYVSSTVPLGVPGLEFIATYDYFNYNTMLSMNQHKAVGGLQYWFFKKCRMQVQYVYKSAQVQNNQFVKEGCHSLQCQMQIRFN